MTSGGILESEQLHRQQRQEHRERAQHIRAHPVGSSQGRHAQRCGYSLPSG